MPVVELHLLEGYDSAEKQRLGAALTDAVRLVVPAAPELITVMIHEMPADRYYRGGGTRAPAPARPDPVQTVRRYLDAMERREIKTAEAMLGAGFTMQFPGAAPMTRLQELMDWAKPRYRFVTKRYEQFDAMQGAGDATVVYCFGTLAGEWLDGRAFAGIRFIDRFEIEGGQITRQDVWNDMAEVKGQITDMPPKEATQP